MNRPTDRPTVASFFTGVGGFDLGFESEGFSSTLQVERDSDCLRVLAKHWPESHRVRDINALTAGQHRNRARHRLLLEPADVMVGGFPCQDVSVAGKRKGLSGSRSGLFFAFMRGVRLMRARHNKPDVVVIENVPGLLSSHGGRDFHAVLTALADSGFVWAYRVLDSQYFGVPQRRRRVFIVGCHRTSGLDPVATLFESGSSGRDSQACGAERTHVAASLTRGSSNAGVNAPGRRREDDESLIAPDIAACLNPGHEAKHSYAGDGGTMNVIGYQCHGSNVGEMGTLRAGNGNVTGGVPFVAGERARALTASMHKRHDDDTDTLIPTLDTTLGHHLSASSHPPAIANTWAANSGRNQIERNYLPALTANLGRRGFGSDRGDGAHLVAKTLNSGGNEGGFRTEPGAHLQVAYALRRDPGGIGQGHNTTSPNGVRRLTPLECERLQAFPDGWTCLCGVTPYSTLTCQCPDSYRYRAMGNAVTVTVIRWIARRIKAELDRVEAERVA